MTFPLEKLATLLGKEHVPTTPEDLIPYSFDGTATFRQLPLAVAFPRTTDQVSACVKLARETNTPIIARGSGTGLSGGTVPTPGALTAAFLPAFREVSATLKSMNRIVLRFRRTDGG